MKKRLTWLAVGLSFMAVLQIGVWIVKGGKTFGVNYIPATQIEGYAGRPAEVRVSASTSIKWKEAPGTWKVIGRIFWLAILGAAWYVGTDKLDAKKKAGDTTGTKNVGKMVGLLMAPVVLCLVCWFAGYSASLSEGQLVKPYDQFINEYQISSAQAERIKQSKSIKDENGLLTAYFRSK